jgi:hypothetical protein
MNSKAVGERSEGIILARILRKGLAVAMPFGNNQRYDMILDNGGILLRVQCKTGNIQDGAVVFPTRSFNCLTGKKRCYVGEADIFLVYCPNNDTIYCVPIDEKLPRDNCSLRVSPSKNSQTKGIRLAKDFEF